MRREAEMSNFTTDIDSNRLEPSVDELFHLNRPTTLDIEQSLRGGVIKDMACEDNSVFLTLKDHGPVCRWGKALIHRTPRGDYGHKAVNAGGVVGPLFPRELLVAFFNEHDSAVPDPLVNIRNLNPDMPAGKSVNDNFVAKIIQLDHHVAAFGAREFGAQENAPFCINRLDKSVELFIQLTARLFHPAAAVGRFGDHRSGTVKEVAKEVVRRQKNTAGVLSVMAGNIAGQIEILTIRSDHVDRYCAGIVTGTVESNFPSRPLTAKVFLRIKPVRRIEHPQVGVIEKRFSHFFCEDRLRNGQTIPLGVIRLVAPDLQRIFNGYHCAVKTFGRHQHQRFRVMPHKTGNCPRMIQVLVGEDDQINMSSDKPVAIGYVLGLKLTVPVKADAAFNDDILSANAEQMHRGANDASNFLSSFVRPVLAKLAVPTPRGLHLASFPSRSLPDCISTS